MRRFAQVDVFTAVPGLGNPVAVVVDADGLPDTELQRLASWTNLSETTFVLPPTRPGADYRVRIFTPVTELPFAGHPTIGTCAALIDAGVVGEGPSWTQECAAGLVGIRRLDDGSLAFAAPPAVAVDPFDDTDLLHRALRGVEPFRPTVIEIGPRWLVGRVGVDELDATVPEIGAFGEILRRETSGITLYAVDDAGDVHVRSFFDDGNGVTEDPVCGSGNATVAAHVRLTGLDASFQGGYRAYQGRHRGRDGRITVSLGEQNWVGGRAVTVVSGEIRV